MERIESEKIQHLLCNFQCRKKSQKYKTRPREKNALQVITMLQLQSPLHCCCRNVWGWMPSNGWHHLPLIAFFSSFYAMEWTRLMIIIAITISIQSFCRGRKNSLLVFGELCFKSFKSFTEGLSVRSTCSARPSPCQYLQMDRGAGRGGFGGAMRGVSQLSKQWIHFSEGLGGVAGPVAGNI